MTQPGKRLKGLPMSNTIPLRNLCPFCARLLTVEHKACGRCECRCNDVSGFPEHPRVTCPPLRLKELLWLALDLVYVAIGIWLFVKSQ